MDDSALADRGLDGDATTQSLIDRRVRISRPDTNDALKCCLGPEFCVRDASLFEHAPSNVAATANTTTRARIGNFRDIALKSTLCLEADSVNAGGTSRS